MISKISVGPFDIAVVFSKEKIDKHFEEKGYHVYGYFEAGDLTIYVDPTLPRQLMQETLLHETLHACLFLFTEDLGEKLEEKIVRCISPNLFGALKDQEFREVLFNAEEGKDR